MCTLILVFGWVFDYTVLVTILVLYLINRMLEKAVGGTNKFRLIPKHLQDDNVALTRKLKHVYFLFSKLSVLSLDPTLHPTNSVAVAQAGALHLVPRLRMSGALSLLPSYGFTLSIFSYRMSFWFSITLSTCQFTYTSNIVWCRNRNRSTVAQLRGLRFRIPLGA